MAKIVVAGHKSPDTDTVCSAIAMAWYLTNVRKTPAEGVVLGSLNKETEFVIRKFRTETPRKLKRFGKGAKVAVVDTNNAGELLDDLEQAEIVELVDHHKLTATIKTELPTSVTIKPLACTATIIWEMIGSKQNSVPKNIAGLMLSAIISDTLNLTSPTTTEEDRSAAKSLAKIAGVKINELAQSMFDAKSDLTGMRPADLLLVDSKLYDTDSVKRRYSVLETTKPENVLKLEDKILEAMRNLRKKENLDHLFFFAVDIIKSDATLLVDNQSDKGFAEKAFAKKFKGNVMKLPGVVSRKKQIIPKLDPVILSK